MNEQTVQLLRDLAAKLGTTSEYLWQVLVKQAPISAIIDILLILLVGVAIYLWYRLHRNLMVSKEWPDTGYKGTGYSRYEEGAMIPMALSGMALLVFLGISLACVPSIISGLLNPEYWALQQILHTI